MRGNLGGGNDGKRTTGAWKTGAGEARNLPQRTELCLKCVETRDEKVAPPTHTGRGFRRAAWRLAIILKF